jgi:hypothetical protein
MSARLELALLGVLSVLQIGATASSILTYESTLRTGTLVRIPTTPIDPADPFRGRYVAVRPTIAMRNPIAPEIANVLDRIDMGETGYVVLARDDEGFARAADVVLQPPAHGDYLRIQHAWPRWQDATTPNTPAIRDGYDLIFSFDRYYMNDAAAPQAQERATRAGRASAASRTWLNVRVKNGVGVIEGLFIDGVPIEDAR